MTGKPTPGGPAGTGAMAGGPPVGPGAKPLGHPPAIMGAPGGAGAPRPSMSARAAIGRSLPMLRAVRGTVVLTIVLGLTATALPFVASAAQGPFAVLFGRAFACGGLGSIWNLSGPVFDRDPNPPPH